MEVVEEEREKEQEVMAEPKRFEAQSWLIMPSWPSTPPSLFSSWHRLFWTCFCRAGERLGGKVS